MKTVNGKPLEKGEDMFLEFFDSGKLEYSYIYGGYTHNREYFYDIDGENIYIFESFLQEPCNVFYIKNDVIKSSVDGTDIYFKKQKREEK